MSAEKHQQLIDEGRLHPDGSRIEVCPTCLRPFAQGEGLPANAEVPEGDAVATPEPVEVAGEAPEV